MYISLSGPLVQIRSRIVPSGGDEGSNKCVCASADTPAAAAVDAVTSRMTTRCSCDVGCPCCGRCVETPSLSPSSWPPLPASSVAALRDVDGFIARYRVSSPPPLIHSPSPLSSDSTAWMLPVSTAQLESFDSTSSCHKTLLEDSRQPLRDTASSKLLVLDYQSTVDGCSTLQWQNNEWIDQTNGSLNSTRPAVDLTTCSMFSSSKADMQGFYDNRPPVAAAAIIYNVTSLEQSQSHPLSSEGVYSQSVYSPVPCVPITDSCNIDRKSVTERGSSLASNVSSNGVSSFSTNLSESGLPSTDRTVYNCSTEADGSWLQ